MLYKLKKMSFPILFTCLPAGGEHPEINLNIPAAIATPQGCQVSDSNLLMLVCQSLGSTISTVCLQESIV